MLSCMQFSDFHSWNILFSGDWTRGSILPVGHMLSQRWIHHDISIVVTHSTWKIAVRITWASVADRLTMDQTPTFYSNFWITNLYGDPWTKFTVIEYFSELFEMPVYISSAFVILNQDKKMSLMELILYEILLCSYDS